MYIIALKIDSLFSKETINYTIFLIIALNTIYKVFKYEK